MAAFRKVWQLLVGKPLDPLDPRTRHAIAVTPLLAWVGLGADGLSSSCYGPEEAFLALAHHTPLALFLALATAATVFIIALGYNQVIELFPTGGGGYRVATALLGAKPGPVSGAALLVDYVLTVATSLASGVDAFFSLLPVSAQAFKLTTEIVLILLMTGLNFRGMRESIMVLLPIFIGFVVLHFGLIVYGVAVHGSNLAMIVPDAVHEAHGMSQSLGVFVMLALLMRAFSLGGGTYTGLEAVSNNVNMLADPRVPNGKVTMWYMSTSLAFTAGGIILLYMLWHAHPVEGETLNAVVFGSVIDHLGLGSAFARHALLWVNRLFPGHFRNVIFLAVGEVDAKAYDGHEHLERLRHSITEALDYYVAHCRRNGIAADYRIAFGTNPVVEFMNLASSTLDAYPNAVCFASKLIFRRVNFLTAWLHNQTPVELQARLHVEGKQMVLLPMNVG